MNVAITSTAAQIRELSRGTIPTSLPTASGPRAALPPPRDGDSSMASSNYFGHSDKPRMTSALPSYSSAVHEKMHLHSRSMSWTVPVLVPIPGVRTRNLRLHVPNHRRVSQFTATRFGRRKAPLLLLIIALASLWGFFSFAKRFSNESDDWASASGESSTLIFSREDLQRIWKWEIDSGHYPSNIKSE